MSYGNGPLFVFVVVQILLFKNVILEILVINKGYNYTILLYFYHLLSEIWNFLSLDYKYDKNEINVYKK